MRMFRKSEGFTLVELMVVVLIIGILVAIAIPVFNSASDSARKRTCQANLRTLDGAIQQYVAADPSNTATMTAGATGPAKNALLPYVKAWPTCPTAGGVYTYNGTNAWTCAVAGHSY